MEIGMPYALLAETAQDLNAAAVPGWVRLLLTIAVFVIPFFLGKAIARALKVREYAFKMGIVLTAAMLGIMPFVYQYIAAAYEQAQYAQQLSTWEERTERYEVAEETLSKLRESKPGLVVITERDERSQGTQIPTMKPAQGGGL